MLKHILFKKVNSIGLSVFRVFYSIILLCEITQLFNFRDIIYEYGEIDVKFIFIFWFPVLIMLILGIFTRFSTVLNYIFSVIIFSSAEAFEYHVFYAYVGINFLLIFLPLSRSISIDSLIFKLKYSTITHKFKNEENVYAVNYLFPVFVGIGLVYLDSVFYKLTSPMWMKGLGMWLPANLPMATWNDFSFIMNNELIVKAVGYSVLVFEMLFIFIFWLKPFRVPLLIIGIVLHLGIAIVFPLPWFGLTAVGLYLLMVPVSFWKKSFNLFKFNNKTFKFYYDLECPLCNKVIIVISHFDIFKIVDCIPIQGNYKLETSFSAVSFDKLLSNIYSVDKKGNVFSGYNTYIELLKKIGWTWPIGFILSFPGLRLLGSFLYNKVAKDRLKQRCTEQNCSIPEVSIPIKDDEDIFIKGFNKSFLLKKFWITLFISVILLQALVSWNSALIQNTLIKNKLSYSLPDRVIRLIGDKFHTFSLKFMGITNHPVFMDGHFKGYNKIIKVVGIDKDGKSELLPILDDNGMPFVNISGAFWVNYTFRTSSPNFSIEKYEKNIKPYINYFEQFQKVGDEKVSYTFYSKNIDIPEDWEYNFLKKQKDKPWVPFGEYIKAEDLFIWNYK